MERPVLRLAADVGNTRSSFGLFDDGSLVGRWRVGTRHWTADELWLMVSGLLRTAEVPNPESVAFACVVPQLRHALLEMCSDRLKVDVVEVGPDTAGIEVDYPFPSELGADRLSNAAAALKLGASPAIVADFGTATTFDVIDDEGRYVGGAIAPGIGVSASELFKKAERLSPVDLRFPPSPLGRSTAQAIQSGVLFGAVGAAERMVRLLSSELRGNPTLWATGGWAAGIVARCGYEFEVVPELTLIGIDEIGRLNEEVL
ncbi:type III pantothenate kinase [Candidatus Fermentibacteria bacterium]|nr:type III pantothenate kinase [Candidatus Fermentibacteria bacterium]